jgi:hypothetical protein
VIVASCSTVGVLIASRRPAHPLGWQERNNWDKGEESVKRRLTLLFAMLAGILRVLPVPTCVRRKVCPS